MADDLGWNAVGYHNPEVKTPHLDQLCKEGIELDNFYVSPMCSPTRAGFMTGRYPIRFGCARSVIPPYRNYGLPTDETTIAEALEKAGYKNRGIFGKWHLGHLQKKWLPRSRGFTEFLGCYNGAIDYFTHEREGELDWHHNEESAHQEGSATALTGKAAAAFIESAAKDQEPFLCYTAFNAPHSPFQVPGRFKEQYAHINDETKKTYYAMITAMDDEIGRILAAIDDAGIADNTLVWFFSDNGGVKSIKGNNAPLKGSKLSVYQGGVRAAACVRFPGRYPGGRKITERTAFIDVMPTALSLAGIVTEQAGCKPFDGIDLNPLLTGTINKLPDRDLYFYHGQQGEETEPIALISKDWKLVVNGPNLVHGHTAAHQVELFRINDDPNESTDVADSHPEVVERLMKQLVDFRKLQPKDAIPPYGEGEKGFTPPKEWKIID
jgi:arylsulfatase B